MKRLSVAAFVVLAALVSATAQTATTTRPASAPASADLEQEFKRILQEMLDARWLHPDRAVAERTLADTYIAVYENGDTETKADVVNSRTAEQNAEGAKRSAEMQVAASIEDVNAQRYGDTTVVHYLINWRGVFHQEPVTKLFRCTEVFVRGAGGWQSVSHTETVIPGEPVAARVDAKVYDDYVGRYQLTPSVIYTVTREGDRLLWGGRSKRELVPENETTFLFRRDKNRKVDWNTLYRVIFVRNDKGQVTHLRLREFPGVEYSAVRIK